MGNIMKKLTKKQIKHYFYSLEILESNFYDAVNELEEKMKFETGIDDLEFFWVEGNVVGIGNEDRTMKLIHR